MWRRYIKLYIDLLENYSMAKNSKDIWGPACWILLHTSAANIEQERLQDYVKLLRVLEFTLPCPDCRQHLKEYFEKHSPDSISNPLEASKYVYELHNHVNRITRKPNIHPSIMQAYYGVNIGGNHPVKMPAKVVKVQKPLKYFRRR